MYCCLVIVSCCCSCSINCLFHGLLSNYPVWLSHAQRYYIWRRGFSETSQALMATQYGRLREFHPETDTIKAYLERVDLYFAANEVAEDKRVPILLSSIGPSTYALLSDLTAPASPGGKTLLQIGDLLRGHYEPKRSVIAEDSTFINGSKPLERPLRILTPRSDDSPLTASLAQHLKTRSEIVSSVDYATR